jgi:hypothetical protein
MTFGMWDGMVDLRSRVRRFPNMPSVGLGRAVVDLRAIAALAFFL